MEGKLWEHQILIKEKIKNKKDREKEGKNETDSNIEKIDHEKIIL